MSSEHVGHKEIAAFANRVVNLHQDDAKKYRDQVHRLRDRLQGFVKETPDFELKKILLSGSLAKHTALATINDADVAVYVQSAPSDVGELVPWLKGKLQTAFPNFHPDQVEVQDRSVRVDFRGSGLSVDVVPIYADKAKGGDWGYLLSQEDGEQLRTNITHHKKFIAKRGEENPGYIQVVRLLKWWVRMRKANNTDFGFKSFLVELVLAKLADNGEELDDYPEALASFFTYIAKTGFGEQIEFSDYAREAGKPGACNDPIRVFDPVNPENNVARKYDESGRQIIVDECIAAGDAIDAALFAPTKAETVNYWQKVFGPSFGG